MNDVHWSIALTLFLTNQIIQFWFESTETSRNRTNDSHSVHNQMNHSLFAGFHNYMIILLLLNYVTYKIRYPEGYLIDTVAVGLLRWWEWPFGDGTV